MKKNYEEYEKEQEDKNGLENANFERSKFIRVLVYNFTLLISI